MIGSLNGTIAELAEGVAIVEVGGVGFEVLVSSETASRLAAHGIGADVKIYTYTHVREDALLLYGFLSRDELNLYKLLITVNGVGPKAGLSVLSAYSAQELGVLISTGDHKAIAKAQGIGAKTAQRVVLELKDKIGKTGADTADFEESPSASSNAFNEAISALAALGYSYNESKSALGGAQGETTEELIKYALKRLAL